MKKEPALLQIKAIGLSWAMKLISDKITVTKTFLGLIMDGIPYSVPIA